MKALVVYASKTGCTTGIAEQIARTLAEQGIDAEVRDVDEAGEPSAFDAVVVGSGIRAGSWHAAARTWVSTNATALKGRPVAFFTCGLTLADSPEKANDVRAYTDALIAESGVTPLEVGVFAGWNEPKRFPFVERTILKLMKAPEGDFRNLDAVDEWARGIAPRLQA